ncbi:MAG: TldD/PmbA family protein, partial [Actinobacteria bacterium]|nr:TldD/PmbA family protein [Actinomycetota bacterium]
MQIINTEGLYAEDERILTRLGIMVVARKDGIIQTAIETIAGQKGFEIFDKQKPEEMARKAAERAILMLKSKPAPTGKMPVVLESGFGGVLFHEACGHGLEADFIQKGASIYKDKIGQKVASPLVTAIDSSLIENGWGSFRFDDEGVCAQKTTLIEEGVLKGFLHSRLTAAKAGVLSTGNGRRQSYRNLPIPRMTNTYIAEGSYELSEMIASVKKGLYAKTLGGGQVDPA